MEQVNVREALGLILLSDTLKKSYESVIVASLYDLAYL
jgi:hypothetical protein